MTKRLILHARFLLPFLLIVAMLLVSASPVFAYDKYAPAESPPAGYAELGNKLSAHHVWEPTTLGWVTGNPSGYAEGETAAFRVTAINLVAGEQYKFRIELDLDASSNGAYAFLHLDPWDTTVQPPSVGTLTGSSTDDVNAAGATIDYVWYVGYEDGTGYTGDATDEHYQIWEVGFTATTTGTAYIVYGGYLAAPGDPIVISPAAPNENVPHTIVPPGKGASGVNGVFQARVGSVGAGDKTVNFSAGLIVPLPPEWSLDKTVTPAGPLTAPTTLQYKVVLKNEGHVAISDITFDDTLVAAPGSPVESMTNDDILNVGETWTWTYTYQVTQAMINAGDDIVNTATASSPEVLYDVEDSTTVAITQNAELSIVKAGTWVDGDADGYADAGEVINYTFTVCNTGTVTLTNVTVTDPKVNVVGGPTTLDVGECDSTTFTGSYMLTQADINAGSVYNTATADSNESGPATDEETVTLPQNAALELTKTGAWVDGDADGYADAGETISYTFTVCNTGTVVLTNVTVTDAKVAVVGGPTTLDVGECDSTTFTGSYTLTQADINAGSVYNKASADSDESGPATDEETVTLPQNAAWSLDKTVTPAGPLTAPTTLEYTVVLKNEGNVAISDITFDDTLVAAPGSPVESMTNDDILNVGETWTWTYTYQVTQAMINAGNDIVNTATASSPGMDDAYDSTTVVITQNAAWSLDKTVTPAGPLTAPTTLEYTVVLENEGNVAISGITFVDSLVAAPGDPVESVTNDDILNVGETWTWTYTYQVTQAMINAGGDIVNTATASSPGMGDVHDSTTVVITQNAALSIVKAGVFNDEDGDGYADEGETISYSFTVCNIGNVTLTNVMVTDPLVTVVGGPTVLDVGECDSTTFSGTYTLTQADIDAGSVYNMATADSDESEPATDEETVTLPQNAALSIVKAGVFNDEDGDGYADEGETISYSFTVCNIGNVTLTNVMVTDPLVTVVGGPTVLDVGECDSTTFSGTYTLTQADIDAGSVYNMATADSDESEPATDEETVTLPQNAALSIVKAGVFNDEDGDGYADEGETISYSFTVCNIGNVTLTNVMVTDPLVTVVGGPTVLDVGECDSTTFSGTYTLTQADIDAGSVYNMATADSDESEPATDEETVTLPQNAALSIVKAGVFNDEDGDGYADEGETISYSFTVCNIGNVTLTNVMVTDPLVTVVGGPTVLDVGECDSTTFSGTYTLTQADIDAGSVYNMATADSDESEPATDEETVTLPQNAALSIVKAGVFNDEDGDGYADEGETISYSFTVCNIGNVTLTNVMVTDPLVTVVGGPTVLDVGECDSTTFSGTYTLTQADIDAGSVYNMATADSDESEPATDEETVTLPQNAALSIVKAGVFNDEDGDGYADEGETISYSFTVCNIGNVTLTNVMVTDPLVTVVGGPTVLDVGECDSTTFSGTYTLTQADIDAGSVYNMATADSDESEPATDEETVTLPQNAALSIVKAGVFNDEDGDGYADEGETISYSFTVCNIGNVTLTNVMVTDPLVTVVGGPTVLDVGECDSTTFSGTYTLTQADIDAGSVYNMATADSDESEPATDEETVTLPQNAALSIVKAGVFNDEDGDGYADEGETISYSFTVCNIGNVTLTNVMVTDPLVTVVGGPTVLDVGECDSTTFSGTYTLTQADIDAGSVYNMATADSDESEPATDEETVTLPQNAALSIVKAGVFNDEDGDGYADEGETISYSFTVCNIGNVTLTNVMVTDPLVTVVGGPTVLDVGECDSTTFSGTYTLTQADIDAGSVYNMATADSDESEPATDEETVTLPQNAALSIVKAGVFNDEDGDGYADEGETISYSFTVCNIGNVTLTNVMVTDPLVTVVGGPTVLDVGECDSTTFSGTYTLTQADIDAGSVYNMATADSDESEPATDEETVTLPQNAALSIVKAGVFNDEDGDGYADEGETISYSFTVCNIGNVTLTNVMVTDPLVTVVGGPTVLDVGECDSTTFSGTYTLTQADIDAGSVYNMATADSDESEPATDEETVTLPQNAALSIVKAGVFNDEDGDGYADEGETISYSFTVCNIGNVTLTNVMVTDPLVTVVGGPTVLDVGECDSTTFSGTYTLTQADIDAGSVYNMATADSDESEPATDEETVTLPQNAAVTLDKTVTAVDAAGNGIIDHPGEVISYQVVVTNTGNVSLTGTLTDSLAGISAISGPVESIATDGILAVGETWTYAYTYTVSAADIAGHGGCDGDIDNTATFTPSAGTPKSDSEEVPIEVPDILPDISVTKTASVTSVPATGGYVDFTFVVTNHSDEPVTLTSLKDSVFGELLSGPVSIAAHGSYTLTINRWIACGAANNQVAGELAVNCPPCTCVDHYNVVTATARDDQGNQDTAKDDATVHFTYVAPSISVTKTASVASVPASGGHVDFTFVVTNNGVEAVTLTSLNDSIFGELLGGPVTIAGHDSFTLTITRWIANDSSEAAQSLFAVSCVPLPPYCGEHHNVVNATAYDCRGNKATAKDDATVRFTYGDRPDISVTKTASAGSVPASGANVDFTFVVTNHASERVTLTSLLDSVFGELLSGPVSIAAHDSYTLTITRWIACGSTSLQLGGLAVSCPVPTCLYHYNKVTATGYDDQGNKDTATDDAKVYFSAGVKPDISVEKTASESSVPRSGANVEFAFVVTNNGSQAVTLTSLCDSVFGELLSGPVTIAAHGGYILTITRWIGCSSSDLAADSLAVSCRPPADPCDYHYNKVTARASDAQGNTDTATDDAWVMYTDLGAGIDDGILRGQGGEDPQAAIGSEGSGGDGAAVQPDAGASAGGEGDQIQDGRESTSASKGFPYYLLALPAVLALAAAALLVHGRLRMAAQAGSSKEKQD